MEVVNFNMENVLQTISIVQGEKYDGTSTNTPGTEGEGDGTDSAPIFFPDLD